MSMNLSTTNCNLYLSCQFALYYCLYTCTLLWRHHDFRTITYIPLWKKYKEYLYLLGIITLIYLSFLMTEQFFCQFLHIRPLHHITWTFEDHVLHVPRQKILNMIYYWLLQTCITSDLTQTVISNMKLISIIRHRCTITFCSI